MKIVSSVKTCLEEVQHGLGRRPLIYSGVSFLESSLVEQGQPPAQAEDHPLWLG